MVSHQRSPQGEAKLASGILRILQKLPRAARIGRLLYLGLVLIMAVMVNAEVVSTFEPDDAFDRWCDLDCKLHKGHHETVAESSSSVAEETESEMRRGESLVSLVPWVSIIIDVVEPCDFRVTDDHDREINDPSLVRLVDSLKSQGPPCLV